MLFIHLDVLVGVVEYWVHQLYILLNMMELDSTWLVMLNAAKKQTNKQKTQRHCLVLEIMAQLLKITHRVSFEPCYASLLPRTN